MGEEAAEELAAVEPEQEGLQLELRQEEEAGLAVMHS